MNILRSFYLNVVFLPFLAACSSDYFLGRDNRPEPKPLPVVSHLVGSTILWEQSVGDNGVKQGLTLKPALLAGKVYAVSSKGQLKAFSEETGELVLNIDLGNEISAGITAADNLLFLGTANGSLLALDAQTGKPKWRKSLSSLMLASPVVVGNRVYARSVDGNLTVFSRDNDTQLWRYHGSTPTLSIRGNAEPVIGGGVVILTTDDGRFIVLDEQNGLPIIEKRITAGIGSNPVARLVDMDTTPKIQNNILYGAAYQSMVFAIDLKEGQPLWRQENVSTPQNIAINNYAVFLVNDIDHLIAINAQNGAILWENDALEGRYLSPPFTVGSTLVGALDRDGYLHWFNAQTGEIIGQRQIATQGAITSAEVVGNHIIWQLNNGKIISFRPEKL